ncbi:MAG: helix-turn-helix domain-containing protein [Eubacterium sp.]
MNIYFSENLKMLRKERNLTQEKLADYLGVTFQAISKWERGEGYPDITTLPVISTFFGITLDELLGINRAETESELISLIDEYDNLNDIKSRKELLEKLIQISPNDFRVLLRELGYLVHFGNAQESTTRIKAIYDNIQQNCNNDRIRICATRHIIIFYADMAKQNDSSISFDDVEKLLKNMPYMRDGQEFISSYLYPKEHPDYYQKIQEAIEEGIGLLDTSIDHYYLYDDNFSIEYKIDMLEIIIKIRDMIYDDGNYGEQWKSVIYSYGHLGHLYFEKGNKVKALQNLKKCAELAKQYDSLDRYSTMHSCLFEGRVFDKHKLGSTYIATDRMKYLMNEKYPLSKEFKNTNEFKEILKIL